MYGVLKIIVLLRVVIQGIMIALVNRGILYTVMVVQKCGIVRENVDIMIFVIVIRNEQEHIRIVVRSVLVIQLVQVIVVIVLQMLV